MRLGPTNATAALQDGHGAVFNAAREAIAMQTLLAAFERDYSVRTAGRRRGRRSPTRSATAGLMLRWHGSLHVVGAGAKG